jgi:hypothetical protein
MNTVRINFCRIVINLISPLKDQSSFQQQTNPYNTRFVRLSDTLLLEQLDQINMEEDVV